jgi:hypothetical protein
MADIEILNSDCDEDDDDKRGKRGKRGHRGHRGHRGLDSGGLLKFSGVVAPAVEGALVTYLTDFGVGLGSGSMITTAPSYPVAVPHNLRNLSTNLLGAVVPVGGSILVELLKNGIPVPGFTITYGPGENGVKSVVAGPVAFAIGDRFDIRVTASALVLIAENLSATVGVE